MLASHKQNSSFNPACSLLVYLRRLQMGQVPGAWGDSTERTSLERVWCTSYDVTWNGHTLVNHSVASYSILLLSYYLEHSKYWLRCLCAFQQLETHRLALDVSLHHGALIVTGTGEVNSLTKHLCFFLLVCISF